VSYAIAVMPLLVLSPAMKQVYNFLNKNDKTLSADLDPISFMLYRCCCYHQQ